MLRLINTTANRNNFKFNPSKFYIDVDLNIIPAIEETFGRGISIKLSLFHYANSIWYKVKSLGLSQNNDVNIKKTIRRICCLAMVPIEQIEDTWIKIKEEAPQNENLLELVSYITETFMISNVGHKFDKTVWNHYDTNNIKTINHLEGWNDFIDEDINKSYLTIKNFVIKLKNKQQSFEMDFIKNHEKSNEISTFPKKFKSIEKKFKRAKERLENGTISAMEYLDEII
ncbi:uncharacterized protein LOC113560224 [Rhopalosiphum maidis]|uniref:uncharacterized protein LOC113560224 n=1 Tax=Rhopalosiphum maidis TaxID=43146 RepID=UPI000EFDD7BD|nr:uncharacterized protein LOC113560224 [Rhopalosiphum maidis]